LIEMLFFQEQTLPRKIGWLAGWLAIGGFKK
jgi:hypothetical protein